MRIMRDPFVARQLHLTFGVPTIDILIGTLCLATGLVGMLVSDVLWLTWVAFVDVCVGWLLLVLNKRSRR